MECGKKKSKTTYSRNDIERMAMERLSLTDTQIRKYTKKELCQLLGISWKEKTQMIVHPEKVCSNRRTKSYPHRYSREELVDLIRQRNPYVNKTRLKKQSFPVLCRLANLDFIKTSKQSDMIVRREKVHQRFYHHKQEKMEHIGGCLERSKRIPFQYQQRVVQHFRTHRGLIAIHSLGSGKTMTAVLASQCFLDEHPDGKIVVISPTSLIANFKKELDQFGQLLYPDRYEFFSFQGFYYKYKDHPRQCRNHFLIIDEAHNLRTAYHKSKSGKEKGKFTHVISKCAEKAKRVLLLTATPLINKKDDIVSLLNMVRDHPTVSNQIKKQDIHDNLRQIGLCKFSFYERERMNQDYPRTIYEDIYLTMKPQFYNMYRKVENELMDDEIMKTFGEESKLKPFFNGIRRAVNILSELPEEDMLKSEKIRWIVDNLRTHPHHKTLIFSHFLEAGVEAIEKKLKKEFPTMRIAYITGSQTKKRRAEIVSQYNQDDLDVLFISKAGGEGLDLKGTRQIILMESGWNENTESQVIGRGVRFRSHSHLPLDEQNVVVYRLHHIKQGENIQEILSPEYEINYNDPSTWVSADLLLKKISQRKQKTLRQSLDEFKTLSIERNTECQN